MHYSPYDHEVNEDPYPVYASLRDEAPIYRNSQLGFWALSRHADVSAAFRDPELFTGGKPGTGEPPEHSGNSQPPGGREAHRTGALVTMNPQRHAQLRTVISRNFTPRRAARLEPLITDFAVRYLEPAVARGSFDFIAGLAEPLPVDVISGLIGVPAADRDDLRTLTLAARRGGDMPGAAAGSGPRADLIEYFTELLDERRRQPTGDLASSLAGADVDGERLTEDEAIGVLLALLDGDRATGTLLGNAWYWAWRNPDQFAVPFKDPGRVAEWVEETLRYDCPTQFVSRTLSRDTRLHGELVPAGAVVLLLTGSANRDPRAFTDPGRYDLDRDTSPMLGFGAGRHLCLGAPLARLTARIVLTELIRRVRDYEIGTEGIHRERAVNVRGFDRLPTTVTPRSGRSMW